MDYQLLPPLTEEEYEALKADIAERGVLVPVECDEQGNILDGYHRVRACEELGIREWPSIVRVGLSEDEKIEHALRLNTHRRQLTREWKQQKAIELRQKGWSTRRIASVLGVSQPTILNWLAQESGDKNLSPEATNAILGRDGKVYPAKKKPAVLLRSPDDIEAVGKLLPEVAEAIADSPLADSPAEVLKLAQMEPDKQKEVASIVAQIGVGTVREAVAELRKQRIEEAKEQIRRNPPPLPEGLYDVIAIDPPWPYGTEYDPETRRVASPYPEMSLEEIYNLRIPAAQDCVLFLWTTHRFLPTAFDLLRHWGFNYKATIVWDKVLLGVGQTLRMQCEFCLLGFKGNPFWVNNQHRDIIREPRTEHSRKPEAFYHLVEACTHPGSRRLDYFARQRRDGWDAYGNEVI